jgi:hypothetical protein
MDDVSIWIGRAFRWLIRPNAADEPEPHGASVHALPRRVEELPIAAE